MQKQPIRYSLAHAKMFPLFVVFAHSSRISASCAGISVAGWPILRPKSSKGAKQLKMVGRKSLMAEFWPKWPEKSG